MQMLSAKLPNGRELHVPFDDVSRALMEVGHAGQVLGSAHTKKPGERKPDQMVRIEAARGRATKALHAAEDAIEAMLSTAVEEVWDRARADVLPYRCSYCSQQFATADELIDHATNDPARDETCRRAFASSLRFASEYVTRETKKADAVADAGTTDGG